MMPITIRTTKHHDIFIQIKKMWYRKSLKIFRIFLKMNSSNYYYLSTVQHLLRALNQFLADYRSILYMYLMVQFCQGLYLLWDLLKGCVPRFCKLVRFTYSKTTFPIKKARNLLQNMFCKGNSDSQSEFQSDLTYTQY